MGEADVRLIVVGDEWVLYIYDQEASTYLETDVFMRLLDLPWTARN